MRFLITYSIENVYFHIYHEDFYGLSNNVLHVLGTRLFLYVLATWKLAIAMWYIQNAQVMECFSSITSAFSNYLFYRNFYFHIYHEDFYGLSNNVLHILGTRLFRYVLATLKLAIAMWYIQNAQVMECFSSITSAFPNYLFHRNFLFSHISWRFLWSF